MEFNRDVLGLPLAEERHGDTEPHWECELGDVHFAINPAANYPADPASGQGKHCLAQGVLVPRRVRRRARSKRRQPAWPAPGR